MISFVSGTLERLRQGRDPDGLLLVPPWRDFPICASDVIANRVTDLPGESKGVAHVQ